MPPYSAFFGAELTFADARRGWLLLAPAPINTGDGRFSSGSPDGRWGPLYHTTDGGQTWNRIQPDGYRSWHITDTSDALPGSPGTLTFVSPTVGWISIDPARNGHGGIARTTDGGRTWTRSAISTWRWAITNVSAHSTTNLWIIGAWRTSGDMGSDFLLHSEDGGRTWKESLRPLMPVTGIDFLDRGHGWGSATTSQPGAVLSTSDSGHSWTQLGSVGAAEEWPAILSAISVADERHVWTLERGSVGWRGGADAPPDVLRTTDDGGRTWRAIWHGEIVAAKTFSTRTGALMTYHHCGDCPAPAEVRVTADDGTHWTSWIGVIPGSDTVNEVQAADFADARSPWIVAWNRAGGLRLLTATIGSQAAWRVVGQLPSDLEEIVCVRASSNRVVWMGANDARGQSLLTTDDGGATWMRIALPPDLRIGSLAVIDAMHGWIVSTSGQLLESADGGITWSTPR